MMSRVAEMRAERVFREREQDIERFRTERKNGFLNGAQLHQYYSCMKIAIGKGSSSGCGGIWY